MGTPRTSKAYHLVKGCACQGLTQCHVERSSGGIGSKPISYDLTEPQIAKGVIITCHCKPTLKLKTRMTAETYTFCHTYSHSDDAK